MKTVSAQGAICALIVAVAMAALSRLGHTADGERAVCIAVLDFRDLGPSVELEPLRRALARMLTTDLSAYAGVEVVARERVDRMIKETHLGESGLVGADTAQKAGRALAADYLVQGTFWGASDGVCLLTFNETPGGTRSIRGFALQSV